MDSATKVASLESAYRLFNERKINDLLAMMTDDVRWPDVAHGIVLEGRQRSGSTGRPSLSLLLRIVVPTGFSEVDDDVVAIIEQRILDLSGNPLMGPVVVYHRYSFNTGLISRMTVFGRRGCAEVDDSRRWARGTGNYAWRRRSPGSATAAATGAGRLLAGPVLPAMAMGVRFAIGFAPTVFFRPSPA